MDLDLEALRSVFKDNRQHLVVAKITKLSMASDRSCLNCMVLLFDENHLQREIVAKMTWDDVGPNSGSFNFPSVNDMVLVAFAEGDVDQAFVIRRMTSKEDKIPINAANGDSVMKSLAGKKAWITSDTRINLSSGDTEPTENVVLGQQLKTLLVDILTEVKALADKVATHTHAGNLGYPTSAPNEAPDFVTISGNVDSLKSSPVEDEAILSQLTFTD